MRKTLLLNDGWQFGKMNDPMMPVSLPHTWNGLDGQDGGGNYSQCLGVYKKIFPRPALEQGGKCVLLFHGVNSEAEVFVNEKKLARHEGGYSSFSVDITEALEEQNELIVTADNRPNDHVYPQFADFTFYGGIYRDVEMLLLPQFHFSFGPHCAPPLKVRAWIEGGKGICKASTYPAGGTRVVISLLDREGNLVAEGNDGQELTVDRVHLWDGVNDPCLYTCRARLYDGEMLTDEVEQKIGFRSFHADPEKGFFLNGRPYPLRGVCKHQDWLDVGNAISKEMMEKDMALLREMGANSVRLTHYQHDQYFYDLCDRFGIVVSTEVPLISQYMFSAKADENILQQLAELVQQNYNHPSVVFWLLANEITIKKIGPETIALLTRMNDYCHREDPDRLTTLTAYMVMNKRNPVAHITDTVSYNLYYGWYVPLYYWMGWTLDSFHHKYPKTPLGLAEYGAEAMPCYHSDHARAMDNTEEYQCIFHEQYLDRIEKRPYLFGTYAWLLADCGSDGRNQGGDPGKNHKGLVTMDRQIKKDAFYLYKAHWKKPEEEAFVHICGKRYVNRAGNEAKIKIYSNREEVSLFCNGRLAEKKTGRYAFCFRVPMKDDLCITVKAEGCQDEMTIHKVDQPDTAYVMRVKSNGLSWEKTKQKS